MRPSYTRSFRHYFRFVCACVILFRVAIIPHPALCQGNPPLTETQEFVLNQIAAGETADLTGHKNRELDAKWLEKLLTNGKANAAISHEGILISNAIIRGRMTLAGAEIPFPVWLNNCDFADDVDFSWSHFARSLSLNGSVFSGGVDLNHIRLDGDLVIQAAQFKNPEKSPDQVLDFSGAIIGGELIAIGAQFLDSSEILQFDSIQAAWGVNFLGASFPSGVDFEHLKTPFLLLGREPADRQDSSKSPHLSTETLNLSNATINGELRISNLAIGTLQANALGVEGTATFENSSVTDRLDLRQSHFSTLILENMTWPANADSRQLAGIKFRYISPVSEDSSSQSGADWNKLRTMLSRSAYNPGAYQELEAALNNAGHQELANDVYVEMNQRAVQAPELHTVSWVKNVLLHYLIGYGRQPQYAFYWCIPVILLGCAVFARRCDVQERKPEDQERPYDAFWYSLDLFLPLTRLDAAEVWMPRQDSWPRRYYARVHATLGWILVPIALAAVTGLISVK